MNPSLAQTPLKTDKPPSPKEHHNSLKESSSSRLHKIHKSKHTTLEIMLPNILSPQVINNDELHQAFGAILVEVFQLWSTSDLEAHACRTDMEKLWTSCNKQVYQGVNQFNGPL